jgi:hypothetical protein
MKYITLIIGLLVVGCGEQEQPDTNESTPTANTNEVDGTTEKPAKELTLREKVVGEYEMKDGEDTYRAVFLANGFVEDYENGKKLENKSKWKIAKGEIHIIEGSGHIDVIRINKDGSLTNIATIDKDGEREDFPKENQHTINKIK